MSDDFTIVFCSQSENENFSWLKHHFEQYKWLFFSIGTKSPLEKFVRHPKLHHIRVSWNAVQACRLIKRGLLVVHSAELAYYVSIFLRLWNVKIPVVVYIFNFHSLPKFPRSWLLKHAYRNIDRFVVSSTYEKETYSKFFDIPAEKFDVLLWSVNPPEVASENTPLFPDKNYICAIGRSGRDYDLLLKAMEELPDIPLVLVTCPNTFTVKPSKNVTVYYELPWGDTMNILKFSEFMVLPLFADTPCGHITIVNSMYLKVPFIIGDSEGISDYVKENETCLVYPCGNLKGLRSQIEKLWNDPALRTSLGTQGQKFAYANFTEKKTAEHFESYLQKTISMLGG